MMLTRRLALGVLAGGMAAPALALPGLRPGLTELAYAPDSPRNLLDIHRPEGAGPFPAILDIHGGGFISGDKRQLAVPRQILAKGIAVVRMNYRLSDQARWPAQQDDVLAAAAFLQTRAAELGLQPGRLALGGRSAGAFMAVSAAISMVQAGRPPAAVVNFYGPMDFGSMDKDIARLGVKVQRLPADSPQSVESLLIGYAVGDRREAATAMGPVGRLDALAKGVHLPPLFSRHGTADTIVSVHQSEHLRDAWRRVDPGAAMDFALLQGEGHGTAGFSSDRVLGDLAGFLSHWLRPAASQKG
ncbi:alpha/beta hydrolase fold domain-containing protein [Paracoccus sp. DK608]|uniref:Alpha/beta hydrolase fold domain-containing protein n=2 Tax=Paracoccus shanxieyensis TaxID=2675752 RepID=A0A6L6J1Y1_9RHOB|nr:alpha/beta hydrolase fold domain-containing protein [Paracoccus shanxieyensis]MTH87851.1 alpha/beta hydrolase fold domain-containing protein [Paracoccus shanxieyensis]